MTPALNQPSRKVPRNTILHGDCVHLMNQLPANSVDFILTDPPYLVEYRPRDGQRVRGDNDADWLFPAYAEMHRVLRDNAMCVTFYGYPHIDRFAAAWRAAGFRPVGRIAFTKGYSASGFYMDSRHEDAFVLAKGRPPRPARPVCDVIPYAHTGNRLHPTQKPVSALRPIIEGFCRPGGLVLDPFCGSGSTLVAARECGRDWLGIELDARHCRTATERLAASDQAN